jgi:hypothetical protein
MKKTATALILAMLFAAAGESLAARSGRSGGHSGARHSGFHSHHSAPRARIGVVVGAPVFFYAVPPPGYYPPLLATSEQPIVYVEQGTAAGAQAQPAGSWYFCAGAQAYYPYVQECAEGWQPVAPIPPAY